MADLLDFIQSNPWIMIVSAVVVVLVILLVLRIHKQHSGAASDMSPEEFAALSPKEKALAIAKDDVRKKPISARALHDKLIEEGYSDEEAEYGVENCNANWLLLAIKAAQMSGEVNPFDIEGVTNYLLDLQFTEEEAKQAALFIFSNFQNLMN